LVALYLGGSYLRGDFIPGWSDIDITTIVKDEVWENESLKREFQRMYIPRPKLRRSFYCQNTLTAARELVGKRLVHRSLEGLTVGEIAETEAYIGPSDPASHAY